jgi:hypothetical protein
MSALNRRQVPINAILFIYIYLELFPINPIPEQRGGGLLMTSRLLRLEPIMPAFGYALTG